MKVLPSTLLFFWLLLVGPTTASAQELAASYFSPEANQHLITRVFNSVFPDFDLELNSPDRCSQLSVQPRAKPVIKVVLLPTDSVQAYSLAHHSPPEVVISKGLLKNLRDEAELAFVLAHEVGHILAGHIPLDTNGFILSERQLIRIAAVKRNWEFEADRFALRRILRAYSARGNSAHQVLYRLEHALKENRELNTPQVSRHLEHPVIVTTERDERALSANLKNSSSMSLHLTEENKSRNEHSHPSSHLRIALLENALAASRSAIQ